MNDLYYLLLWTDSILNLGNIRQIAPAPKGAHGLDQVPHWPSREFWDSLPLHNPVSLKLVYVFKEFMN